MTNHLVKIINRDDGSESGDDSWHLVDPSYPTGGAATLCTQEFFGIGESGGVIFEEKQICRGGITCDRCLDIVKMIKRVKL